MPDSHISPNRFNSGDAVQIGAGMGIVMMITGVHLIDAVTGGIGVSLSILGVMAIIKRFRN